jgi:hypothetical protein
MRSEAQTPPSSGALVAGLGLVDEASGRVEVLSVTGSACYSL